jgi:hypothetical protein
MHLTPYTAESKELRLIVTRAAPVSLRR